MVYAVTRIIKWRRALPSDRFGFQTFPYHLIIMPNLFNIAKPKFPNLKLYPQACNKDK